MKKYLFSLVGFAILSSVFLLLASPVAAQYGQYGQYSGPSSPSQSILIDKQVGKPSGTTKGGLTNYDYVDNLTPSDTRFTPGAVVMFKIRVKNTSSTTLNPVTVADTVPTYLEPIEGPGSFNSTNRIISFDAGSFTPDQEKTYYLKMQVNAQDKLPVDKGLFCVSNYAKAYNNSVSDDDTAQLCIEKQVVGVKVAPKAGPEMNILLIAGQLGLLGFGLQLKKNANRKTQIV